MIRYLINLAQTLLTFIVDFILGWTNFDSITQMIQRLGILLLEILFGWLYLWDFIKGLLWKGPWRMFTVKPPGRRPGVLDNEELGEHKYARLKVGNEGFLYY